MRSCSTRQLQANPPSSALCVPRRGRLTRAALFLVSCPSSPSLRMFFFFNLFLVRDSSVFPYFFISPLLCFQVQVLVRLPPFGSDLLPFIYSFPRSFLGVFDMLVDAQVFPPPVSAYFFPLAIVWSPKKVSPSLLFLFCFLKFVHLLCLSAFLFFRTALHVFLAVSRACRVSMGYWSGLRDRFLLRWIRFLFILFRPPLGATYSGTSL